MRERPKIFTERISIKTSPTMLAQLAAAASASETNPSQYVRAAIVAKLSADGFGASPLKQPRTSRPPQQAAA